MVKIAATKVNMTTIWKSDEAIPVTALMISATVAPETWDDLQEGKRIAVAGTSKGKGFQGVVKRHGFHGGPKSHGQKDRLRAPGSLGPTAPQRVLPGRKMAGHMGNARVTTKNLSIVESKKDARLLFVRGAVPGPRGGKVEIKIVQ
ncbi:MAG: 50S ribosomal protein L3 [Candidatus Brennerbacteria bacterium]|nr:50S ribosomal protein L3 [Candidatus Brennerbacteria bacterium]